jgi:hypothetical protein
MRNAVTFCWALFCFAVFSLPALAQEDPPSTGNMLGDARLIITSDKGDVRLWNHPPRVLMIASDPFVLGELAKIRETVNENVAVTFGPTFFGDWDVAVFDSEMAKGNHWLGMRTEKGGPSGRQIKALLGDAGTFYTDIVIAVGDRPTIAVLNGLWSRMPGHYTRAQMEGSKARCYYQSLTSDNNIRRSAYVSIVLPTSQDVVSECLWEEVLHTLGPLGDAVGSRFFTFDEQIGTTTNKRYNDILLIRALYESGAGPGGDPEIVIDYLDSLIGQ